MKRLFTLLMLLSLLVLAACSSTPPDLSPAPDDAGTSIANFRFDIDPGNENVTVTTLGSEGVQTQQYQDLNTEEELVVANARYIFGPNNTLTIKATFRNAKDNLSFSDIKFFAAISPSTGNYISSRVPKVTKADLGGDGVLSPGETTSTLTFTVKHKGQKFSYSVGAYAIITEGNEAGCGADGTFAGNATIRTQADIDAFGDCTTIDGSFTIDTDASTLDFSPLDSLRVITKAFRLADREAAPLYYEYGGTVNPNLTAVSGFHNLERVGGWYVMNNPSLTTLSGFDKLSSGAASFDVFGFYVINNPKLRSIPNFGGITNIAADLWVEDNPLLTSLPGFDSLKTVATFVDPNDYTGDYIPFMYIHNNASLTSLSGFGQLERVEGAGIFIQNNSSLATIEGFGNLERAGGYYGGFNINDNSALTSIAGFEKFDGTAGGDSAIYNNPVFDCSIPPQSNLPFLPVDFSKGNLVNCPTE